MMDDSDVLLLNKISNFRGYTDEGDRTSKHKTSPETHCLKELTELNLKSEKNLMAYNVKE